MRWLILNKSIDFKNIKINKNNFKSITKRKAFINSKILINALQITEDTTGVYKRRTKFINLFQRACYSAFLNSNVSSNEPIHFREFIIIFDPIFTAANLAAFISQKYFIVFSSKTNQFVFIDRNKKNWLSLQAERGNP